LVTGAFLLALIAPGRVPAKCTLGRMAELAVTMSDGKPLVAAEINGADAMFVADSGAFYSMVSPASAAEFKLRTYPAPFGLVVNGVGGDAGVSVARVKEFTLAGAHISNIEFLVGGGEAGGDSVGVLGQNVFRIGDVEYDLGKGAIRLMREDGCGKANLAYWVSGTQAFSMMDIQWTTPLTPHTTGMAYINGVKIRVMFDTGADTSFLSRKAAESAGIKVDAPGVTYAGLSRGIGREQVKTWIAPVTSFKVGDEEIRNTRLRIGDTVIDSADMLIGADFFLSHRVYVASKQHKLFFTYNGGPVFNLAAAAPPPGAPAPAADVQQPENSPDEPKNAAEYSRRGSAFAARRDFDHAVADLTRACELAPEEPNYFYELGVVHWEDKRLVMAVSDFDTAIQLKPDHLPALVARAELRLMRENAPGAIEDLSAADHFAAKEADVRLRMASAYSRADRLPSAIAQLDLWIAAHAADARMVQAMSDRCQAKALSGHDLAGALEDCSSALKRLDKKDPNTAPVFARRGLVRLRLGDYDKSIADYDAALKLQPEDAPALYGRAVDKLRRGKSTEGQSDMAAAKALWPQAADVFGRYGITP
jgi:tetratricopeptide (TPR) repeat protein